MKFQSKMNQDAFSMDELLATVLEMDDVLVRFVIKAEANLQRIELDTFLNCCFFHDHQHSCNVRDFFVGRTPILDTHNEISVATPEKTLPFLGHQSPDTTYIIGLFHLELCN